MGKKSKKYTYGQKKEKREALNDTLFPPDTNIDTLRFNQRDTLQFNQRDRHSRPIFLCSHGDPSPKGRSENEKRKWLKRASCIARFGQKYAFLSTVNKPNEISYLYLRVNSQLIDMLFVKIAYGSATDELLEADDAEVACYKTELAIIAECWIDQGQSAFERALTAKEKPQWMKDMDGKLDMIRKGKSSLTLFLASQVPCHCLAKLVQKAEQEKDGSAKESCDHGKPLHLPEELCKEMEKKICEFAFLAESSPRNFYQLLFFFELNPTLRNRSFVSFAFALASFLIVEGRKYQFAERVCNLALMAEVYVEHGVDEVKAAMQRMEETNEMEPYLRDLYVDMRRTCDVFMILRLLSHKVPCDCLDDLKVITGAEDKGQCDICYKVFPKSKFKICSRCEVEFYCSRECADADYPKHKVMCKRLATALNKK